MRSTEASSKWLGRHIGHPGLTACAVGLMVCLAAMLVARPASAQKFTFHLEPAAAFFVDNPQMTRFTPGFYLAARPGIALGRFVALQWTYAFLLAPAGKNYDEDGLAHFVLAGIRLRPLASLRPPSENLGGLFVDFNLGYVRTEDLDRFGFDAGLGYGFQVVSWLSLGPVVRYGQIVQPDGVSDQDPNDAQFFTVGLDIAFGQPHKAEAELECPDAPECGQQRAPAPQAVECVQPSCPDWDQDGVCDIDDRCPKKIGPPATLGCPVDPCSGEPLVVLVQFKYDSATLPVPKQEDPQTMDPVLDAVAEAIAKDPTCRVCIMGLASEEGSAQYNLDLSNRRAAAVKGYLTARGVSESRVPSTGFGKRCQLVPHSSRRLNRRVEFRRLQEGESCPQDCLSKDASTETPPKR